MANSEFLYGTAIGAKQTPNYYPDIVVANLYPSCYVRPLGTLVTVPLGHGVNVKVPRWTADVAINSTGNAYATATSSVKVTDCLNPWASHLGVKSVNEPVQSIKPIGTAWIRANFGEGQSNERSSVQPAC